MRKKIELLMVLAGLVIGNIMANPIVDTGPAELVEKLTIAHWKLDGDAVDSTGNGWDGTIVGTPVTVAGQIDDALDFDDPGEYAEIPAFDKPDVFTIAAWVNTANTGDSTVFGWSLGGATIASFRINDGVLSYEEYSESDGLGHEVAAGGGLNNGQWHHVAVIYNNGQVELFIDGLSANSGTMASTGAYVPAEHTFNGILDDVRLYNYPLTAEEVADIYVAVEGPICLPGLTADLSGDCVVGLEDFAMLAAEWLD